VKHLTLFLFLAVISFNTAHSQTKINASEASKHVGETVTVCDKVYSTKLIENSQMTLLNLGGYYPNQLLTIMIPGKDRNKFKEQPENSLKGKNVCVTGKVTMYRNKPEIVVNEPSQITVQ
jgi:DNA/RNA endonuclease YhcR with UshA esterase domain